MEYMKKLLCLLKEDENNNDLSLSDEQLDDLATHIAQMAGGGSEEIMDDDIYGFIMDEFDDIPGMELMDDNGKMKEARKVLAKVHKMLNM